VNAIARGFFAMELKYHGNRGSCGGALNWPSNSLGSLGKPTRDRGSGRVPSACRGLLHHGPSTRRGWQAHHGLLNSHSTTTSRYRAQAGEYLFRGLRDPGRLLARRQHARLVSRWVAGIGRDPCKFGTHSMRRTKATPIYRRTGNLHAAQLCSATPRSKAWLVTSL
jgi:hypothetical protein